MDFVLQMYIFIYKPIWDIERLSGFLQLMQYQVSRKLFDDFQMSNGEPNAFVCNK